jgi:hypothetical protein
MERALIKDDNLAPSSLELFDLMHLKDCDDAIKFWHPDWTRCPVCFCGLGEGGRVYHVPPYNI